MALGFKNYNLFANLVFTYCRQYTTMIHVVIRYNCNIMLQISTASMGFMRGWQWSTKIIQEPTWSWLNLEWCHRFVDLFDDLSLRPQIFFVALSAVWEQWSSSDCSDRVPFAIERFWIFVWIKWQVNTRIEGWSPIQHECLVWTLNVFWSLWQFISTCGFRTNSVMCEGAVLVPN